MGPTLLQSKLHVFCSFIFRTLLQSILYDTVCNGDPSLREPSLPEQSGLGVGLCLVTSRSDGSRSYGSGSEGSPLQTVSYKILCKSVRNMKE